MTPFDVLAGLVLEDESLWGQSAAPFQWDLARQVLAPPGDVRQWWDVRPRGGRKTTDVAGMLLSLLVTQAPRGSRSYIGATDEDQAAEVVDAARGLVDRTPALARAVTVRDTVIEHPATGATVTALPADASAFGKRPWAIVLDEPTNWPGTRRATRFWNLMVTSARKVPGCRLLVTSNAGVVEHWTTARWKAAVDSPLWWTREIPGPLPWLSELDVQALRENATVPSEFERLVMGRWTEGDDRLVTDADLEAAVTLDGPLPARAGRRYVMSLDLGLVNDRTVVVVAHREPDGRVVVDVLLRWQGSRATPVPMADVEAALLDLWQRYKHPRLIVDPWQAASTVQRLRRSGVRVEEFTFGAASVGRIAGVLHRLLRDHAIDLPADDVLVDELRRVRLRANTLGTVRLDHDAGGHDDQAVAIALCAQALVTQPTGGGSVHAATGSIFRPMDPEVRRMRDAALAGTGLQIPRGSALLNRRGQGQGGRVWTPGAPL